MLNIMRKSKIIICFFAFVIFSCNDSNDKITIYNNSNSITYDFEFYKYKNAEYIYIKEKSAVDILENKIIDSLILNFDGKKAKAKPIKILSSHFEPADYIFPVKTDGKVDVVDIDGKKMFTIAKSN